MNAYLESETKELKAIREQKGLVWGGGRPAAGPALGPGANPHRRTEEHTVHKRVWVQPVLHCSRFKYLVILKDTFTFRCNIYVTCKSPAV